MKGLFIVHHPPYGTEHAFNALRLVSTLSAQEGWEVRAFLQGDVDVAEGLERTTPGELADWIGWAEEGPGS